MSNQSIQFLQSQQTLVSLPQPVARNLQFFNAAVRGAVNSGNNEAVKNTAAQYGVMAALSGAGAYNFQLAPKQQNPFSSTTYQ